MANSAATLAIDSSYLSNGYERAEPKHRPYMVPLGDGLAPAAPVDLNSTGLDAAALIDLTLKVAASVSRFTTEWATRRVHLPQALVSELLEQLRIEEFVEVLGESGPLGFRYAATRRGRERAAELMEMCGYVGPAPVSLEAYATMLEWEMDRLPEVSRDHAAAALSELVLPDHCVELAVLAVSSGRSLFLFGPPGNGKTSLGRLLHKALTGAIWVPYAIGVENSIIRVFDPQCHKPLGVTTDRPWEIDNRWVRVCRPHIVVGGEMTLQSVDLNFSPALRYYEAPLHVKANGGMLLIDDFGRQRVDPHQLLNRWIIPLEHQFDFLTLHTGQKIQVPVRQMLIIATNLKADDVTDAAFLRRIGYRLYLGEPTPEQFKLIFERYTNQLGVPVSPGLVEGILARYRAEGRELRCCEPRDLIERARDVCRSRGEPLQLTEAILDLCWAGYFGIHAVTPT